MLLTLRGRLSTRSRCCSRTGASNGGPCYPSAVAPEPTSLDRFMNRRAPAMAFVGLAGFALLTWVALASFSAPWELDTNSPTVMSSSAECDVRVGALYEIRVDGETYGGCGGATNKCAEIEAVAIAYDPDDPAQCRVASAVDGFWRYETTVMLLGFGMALAGVAALTFLASQRVPRSEAGGERRFAALQRVSWVALAAAVLTSNATALFALL